MKSYCASILSIFLFSSLSVIIAQTDSASFSNSGQLIDEANELNDQGDYAGAILLLNKVGICDPQYPRACYELALNLYNVGQTNRAMAKCREAEYLQFDQPYLYSLMGSILDDQGKPADGIEILNKALKKWPFNQNLMYNLAVCLLNDNKPDQAEKILVRALVYYPYHTRSHLALAQANYAMGRIAESYFAFNMAILLTPNLNNIREFENAINSKLKIIPRGYLYPYPDGTDHRKWDEARHLLQSELAFNESFDFPYNLNFTVTRQSFMLIKSLPYENGDTTFYNRFYARLFSQILESGQYETYLNYCLKNTGNQDVEAWINKNPDKISGFISWAQQFLDMGRMSGFYPDKEEKGIRINHYNENGGLSSIGVTAGREEIKNGDWLTLGGNGNITERGVYVSDKAEDEWLVFWPDGTIKQKLTFLHDKLNGTVYTYYRNGSKEGVYPVKMGLKDGKTFEYTASGLPTLSNTYTDNLLNGPGIFYNYEEGFIREFRHVNDTLDGRTTEKWLNGVPKTEAFNKKGEYDGPFQTWYPNGKKGSAYAYTAGIRTGRYTIYHYNGALREEGEYDTKGDLTGEYRLYDKYGVISSVAREYKSGVLTGQYSDFYPNGMEKTRRSYVQDTLKKIECFDGNGKLLYVADAIDDRISFRSYYADGILNEEGVLENGNRTGIWRIYNPIGVLIEELNYKQGLQSGLQKTYYGNGSVKAEFVCDSGYITGIYREYFKGGKLQSLGNYRKEGSYGEWITFYPNDSVSTRSFYMNGILNGRTINYTPAGKIASEHFYNDEGKAIRSVYYNHLGELASEQLYEYGSITFTDRYPDGQIRAVTRYCDNTLHGLQETWYPNGQLAGQVRYVYGKRDSILRRWDYNGNLQLELNYLMGKAEGPGKWFEDGIPDYVSNFENGLYEGKVVDYHYNGKMARDMYYVNDERNGSADYYAPDGNFMYRLRYENNIIKGYTAKDARGNFMPETAVTRKTEQIIIHYPNGKIAVRFGLKDGLYSGKYRSYFPTGILQREAEYNNDELVSVETTYYANGRPREVINYLHDERNGTYLLYDENGVIRIRGSYLEGEKDQEWHIYDSNGKETETLFYYHDDLYDIRKI